MLRTTDETLLEQHLNIMYHGITFDILKLDDAFTDILILLASSKEREQLIQRTATYLLLENDFSKLSAFPWYTSRTQMLLALMITPGAFDSMQKELVTDPKLDGLMIRKAEIEKNCFLVKLQNQGFFFTNSADDMREKILKPDSDSSKYSKKYNRMYMNGNLDYEYRILLAEFIQITNDASGYQHLLTCLKMLALSKFRDEFIRRLTRHIFENHIQITIELSILLTFMEHKYALNLVRRELASNPDLDGFSINYIQDIGYDVNTKNHGGRHLFVFDYSLGNIPQQAAISLQPTRPQM